MIIWSGYGLLVPAIVVLSLLFGWKLGDAIGGPNVAGILVIVFLTAAGVGMIFLGRYLKRTTGKILLDPNTRKEVIVGGYHSFFFVPMHIWGWIIVIWCGSSVVIGMFVAAFRLIKGE